MAAIFQNDLAAFTVTTALTWLATYTAMKNKNTKVNKWKSKSGGMNSENQSAEHETCVLYWNERLF